MGRPKKKIPSYLPHASGQARVRINGRDIYLGKFGSPESKEKYARLIAEHFSDQTTRTVVTTPGEPLAIASLVVKYDDFALEYYKKNDEPTSQVERIRMAVRPLVKLYGNLPAHEFSPKKLQAVRAQMIQDGSQRKAHKGNPLSRGYVNSLVGCIKRMFKWAVAEELIPVEVFQRVDALENLKKGRCPEVLEPEPIKPVAQELIDPVMELACPQIRAMIQLQLLTGMRPDEVTIMRPQDIERTGDLWVYRPGNHKTEHHEIQKQILLGPQAQKVLEPWLDREDSAFLFSPREVMQAFNELG